MDRGRASLEVPGEGNLISPKSPLERTIRAPQARPITGGGAPGVTPTLGAISPHPPPERPPSRIFRKNAHSALERVFVRKQPKHGRRYYKRGGLRRRASRPRRVHRVGHIGRPSLPLGPLAGYRHRRRACPEHLGSHARPAADRGCGVPARRDARIIASSGFGSSAASSPPASPTAAVASALARSRTRYPQRRLGGGRSVRASPQKDLFRGFAQQALLVSVDRWPMAKITDRERFEVSPSPLPGFLVNRVMRRVGTPHPRGPHAVSCPCSLPGSRGGVGASAADRSRGTLGRGQMVVAEGPARFPAGRRSPPARPGDTSPLAAV